MEIDKRLIIVTVVKCDQLDSLIKKTYGHVIPFAESEELYDGHSILYKDIDGFLSDSAKDSVRHFSNYVGYGCGYRILLNDLVSKKILPRGNILITS